MKLHIYQDFSYWHGGCNRADYTAGQEVEAEDEEMIAVATAEGWAGEEPAKVEKTANTKAHKAAPEKK